MTLLNDTSSMEPSTLPLARVPTPIQESVCCRVLCWVIHQPVSFDEPGCEAHTRQAGVTVSSPHRNLFWGQQVLSAGLQAWPSALTKREIKTREELEPVAYLWLWAVFLSRGLFLTGFLYHSSPRSWLNPRGPWPQSCLETVPGS